MAISNTLGRACFVAVSLVFPEILSVWAFIKNEQNKNISKGIFLFMCWALCKNKSIKKVLIICFEGEGPRFFGFFWDY